MEGLHILAIDGVIIEAVQVDAHGGTKVIRQAPAYTTTLQKWHWEIVKLIEQASQ